MAYYAIEAKDGIYIQHHGILGQKWGVRRYQNEDGTLTEAGRKRYYREYVSEARRYDLAKQGNDVMNKLDREIGGDKGKSLYLAEKKAARKKRTDQEHKSRIADINPEKWAEKDRSLVPKITGGITSAAVVGLYRPKIAEFTSNLLASATATTSSGVGAALGSAMSTSLVGTLAFTVGSYAAKSFLDKYGDMDINELFGKKTAGSR